MLLQKGEVELQLAWKVLVQDGLADPGAVGDLVHRGRVVTAGDEDLLSCGQELAAAPDPGQAGAPGAGV
ncbi:hypothetical protein GCM10026982_17110 [Nocardiopsis aegyptia]